MYLVTNSDTFNNNDDDSFDKDIPDADSKKVTQHIFIIKTNMHGKYVSYVSRMREKETFDVMKKCEGMYYDKAESPCILGIVQNLSGKKNYLCVSHLWFVQKLT